MKVVTTFNVDRLLVEFEVEGHPRPHDFTMKWKGGKLVPKPNQNLLEWQANVGVGGRTAMGYREPYAGDVVVRLTFEDTPRGDEAYGTPLTTPVRWDRNKGKGLKTDVQIPDIDNLVKAVLDGLAGIVLANDVTVAKIDAVKLYGPNPGVSVSVYAI